MTATAINPVDWKIRDWGMFIEEYPAVVGSDAAGEVVAAGKDVQGFQAGDRVFFQGILGKEAHSTFQQYVTMHAELVGHTPKSVTDEEAAGVCLAIMAVLAAFYHADGLDIQPHPWQKGGDQAGKGKSIVVLGGSSSVGQYAIQLARLSGFSTIVTGSSPAHHELLKSFGATAVLDRNTATPSDYAQAASVHPLGAVLDSVSSPETGVEAVKVLAAANPNGVPAAAGLPQSTMIHLLGIPDEVAEAARALPKANVATKNVWGLGSGPHLRPTAVEFMKALSGEHGYLATGAIRPNRPLVVEGGLASLEEALAKNKKGVSGRKLVIRPNE